MAAPGVRRATRRVLDLRTQPRTDGKYVVAKLVDFDNPRRLVGTEIGRVLLSVWGLA